MYSGKLTYVYIHTYSVPVHVIIYYLVPRYVLFSARCMPCTDKFQARTRKGMVRLTGQSPKANFSEPWKGLGERGGVANARHPSAWALFHHCAPSSGVLCAVQADICGMALVVIGYSVN